VAAAVALLRPPSHGWISRKICSTNSTQPLGFQPFVKAAWDAFSAEKIDGVSDWMAGRLQVACLGAAAFPCGGPCPRARAARYRCNGGEYPSSASDLANRCVLQGLPWLMLPSRHVLAFCPADALGGSLVMAPGCPSDFA